MNNTVSAYRCKQSKTVPLFVSWWKDKVAYGVRCVIVDVDANAEGDKMQRAVDDYIRPHPGAASRSSCIPQSQGKLSPIGRCGLPKQARKGGGRNTALHDRDRRLPFRQMTTVLPLPVSPRILEHFLEQYCVIASARCSFPSSPTVPRAFPAFALSHVGSAPVEHLYSSLPWFLCRLRLSVWSVCESTSSCGRDNG